MTIGLTQPYEFTYKNTIYKHKIHLLPYYSHR